MINSAIFILIWLGLMAMFSDAQIIRQKESVFEEEQIRVKWWYAILVFLPLILFAGARKYFGDTTAYIQHYLQMPNQWGEISNYIKSNTKDIGFQFVSCVLHIILGQNFYAYLLFFSIIQGILLLCFFRKYSDSYILSVFLFVASADYYSWMYNALRQCLAVTLSLSTLPLILNLYDKKVINIRYLLIAVAIVILASTLHQSALLLLIILPCALGDFANQRTILFIFCILISIVFLDYFELIMEHTLQSTQYKNVVSDYHKMSDDGTNPLRVIVYSIPAIIAISNRKKIQASKNKLINYSANMALLASGIYILSMMTSGVYIGRIPIYCSLYNYILLPWEINYLCAKKWNRQLILLLLIFFYLIFFYYQIFVAWKMF